MNPAIVTFTTDFGTSDWFAGTMEGVVARLAPRARTIAITHAIPPQNIQAGAFALMAACPYFPTGSIHLAIVDPGVGTTRKAIAVRSARFTFIGPDNGVLSWALRAEEVLEIRELTNPDLFLANLSQTFHGRDIFAPVAAHLAEGVPFDRVGPRLKAFHNLPWPEPRAARGRISGEIIYIDRYGNAVTNLPASSVAGGVRQVRVGRRTIPFHDTYGAAEAGTALCLPGSHGYLELAVNGGSAERMLRLKTGETILVR